MAEVKYANDPMLVATGLFSQARQDYLYAMATLTDATRAVSMAQAAIDRSGAKMVEAYSNLKEALKYDPAQELAA